MGSLCLEGTVCKPDGPGREFSDQSRWSCERFAMAFFGPDGTLEDRMVCLCAEPGSGRREILTHVLSIVSRLGVQVFRRNFEGSTPDAASARSRSSGPMQLSPLIPCRRQTRSGPSGRRALSEG